MNGHSLARTRGDSYRAAGCVDRAHQSADAMPLPLVSVLLLLLGNVGLLHYDDRRCNDGATVVRSFATEENPISHLDILKLDWSGSSLPREQAHQMRPFRNRQNDFGSSVVFEFDLIRSDRRNCANSLLRATRRGRRSCCSCLGKTSERLCNEHNKSERKYGFTCEFHLGFLVHGKKFVSSLYRVRR